MAKLPTKIALPENDITEIEELERHYKSLPDRGSKENFLDRLESDYDELGDWEIGMPENIMDWVDQKLDEEDYKELEEKRQAEADQIYSRLLSEFGNRLAELGHESESKQLYWLGGYHHDIDSIQNEDQYNALAREVERELREEENISRQERDLEMAGRYPKTPPTMEYVDPKKIEEGYQKRPDEDFPKPGSLAYNTINKLIKIANILDQKSMYEDARKIDKMVRNNAKNVKKLNKKDMKRRAGMLVELFKLAYTLDKKSEYELSNDVDEVIKELSQRAGLTRDDMVSLADYFDEKGEATLADKFDEMLKKASNG